MARQQLITVFAALLALCALWFARQTLVFESLSDFVTAPTLSPVVPAVQKETPIAITVAPKEEVMVKVPSPPVLNKTKWIIGVTVAGSKPYYSAAVARVIAEYAKLMPAWTVRICYDSSTPPSALELAKNAVPPGGNPVEFLHANDIRKRLGYGEGPAPPNYMVWRFVSAFEDDVERTISRDSDSMPLKREALAIQEWIDSGKSFHTMRDHPFHDIPILGGMWGVTHLAIPRSVIDSMLVLPNVKGNDQSWLVSKVWPLVRTSVLAHDAYYCKVESFSGVGPGSETRPFPTLRPSAKHHVGGAYNGVAGEFIGLDMDTTIKVGSSDPWACCVVQPAPVIGNCACCREYTAGEAI